jgi:hypothetical protein
MKIVSFTLVLMFGFALVAFAQNKPSAQLEQRAKDVVAIINEPKDFEKVFSPDFLTAVPPALFTETSKKLLADFGKAQRVEKIEAKDDFSGKIFVLFEKGIVAGMEISVENKAPFLINGLRIVSAEKASNSFDDIVRELKSLPGQTALTIAKLGEKDFQPIVSHNSDAPLAIGSTFKLYILSELVRSIAAGERKWMDVVELKTASLPSGMMQNWEIGAPVTLHTLASMMISISDNTATDQLLTTLGREKVEKMMSATGNSKPDLSLPFLTTLELFKLKGSQKQKLAETYLAKDVNGRRTMLNKEIAVFKEDDINLDDFLKKPVYVSQLEWFASTNDLTRLMNWLRLNTEKTPADKARGVLSINKALPDAKNWNYVGYKGGSETGVISLTYLLQSKKGEWFVVSASWNDEKSAVNNENFALLVQKVVKILQGQVS